jgi:hypothetical protein
MTVDAPTAGKREADEKVKAEVVLVRYAVCLNLEAGLICRNG